MIFLLLTTSKLYPFPKRIIFFSFFFLVREAFICQLNISHLGGQQRNPPFPLSFASYQTRQGASFLPSPLSPRFYNSLIHSFEMKYFFKMHLNAKKKICKIVCFFSSIQRGVRMQSFKFLCFHQFFVFFACNTSFKTKFILDFYEKCIRIFNENACFLEM